MTLRIEYLPIDELIPYARNMNDHSDEHIAELAASIKEFGWTNPPLIDKDSVLVAGHGRILAARQLGIMSIPCIRRDHWTPAQVKAYRIADNRLPKNATVNTLMLSAELMDLKAYDFELGLLGFNESELHALLNPEVAETTKERGDPDEVPEIVDTRCKPGDLWILGKHRLLCGDSTDFMQVERLMGGEKADMVSTDPPYGVKAVGKSGRIGGGGIAKSGVYSQIIGDDTTDTAEACYNICVSLKIPVIVLWGGNYYSRFCPPKACWLVWDKRGDMASNNFADCELAWTNLDSPARFYKQIWSGMIKEGESGKRVHPTQKPIDLTIWTFDKLAPASKTVLDLFLGSGSTLIACEKTSRRCFGMELDPKYCDVILARWEKYTGLTAELLEEAD